MKLTRLHRLREWRSEAVDSTLPKTIYIIQYSSSGYDGDYEAVATVIVEPTLRYIGAGMMKN